MKIAYLVAGVLAILMLANGIWMILSPEAWYWAIPGVPDRGPFNQHFVRDIGIAYFLIGISFAAGIRNPTSRTVLWFLPSAWLAGHGLFHFWEVAVGICGPESLVEDFAGVTLPAAIGLVLSFVSYKERTSMSAQAVA